ncbi:hypothetical protein DEU56DRAFT_487600 [Suillus clintonianus]|uniref:uncharacterized protein n=1 Tax=Suillus clintonianus TaxID=1904413 RepID=UPI001B86E08F|nr:uncharacterized protein DEU56DRAFT_487600 [Suillus clintonianus]KAG2129902.1 hypothetical protein DEU56DRAFT_487600 [Suillus clintonianus]
MLHTAAFHLFTIRSLLLSMSPVVKQINPLPQGICDPSERENRLSIITLAFSFPSCPWKTFSPPPKQHPLSCWAGAAILDA